MEIAIMRRRRPVCREGDQRAKPELDQLSNHSGFVVMKKPPIGAEFAHSAIGCLSP
jgi:hypothetical protein